ncbi:MAG: LysR family transcriptional regulator [Burkholderiales bacterium]
MDRFHAIGAFVKVVEAGSFAGAATRLDVSVSSVSRLVTDLEAHLDARLLNRTTRRLSLTEAGRAFHEHAVQLLADLAEAEQSAAAGSATPRGTLRLSCGVTFGTLYIAPALAAMRVRHPELEFDVELSDRIVDLVDEGFDAAVRIGALGGENFVGRRVGESHMIACAAPAYLARRGTPATPADLVHHACLLYRYSTQRDLWPFVDAAGRETKVRVSGPLHSNNGSFSAAMAVAGVGVAFEPDFIVGPDVRAGRLVPILQDYLPPPSAIHVVYANRRHLSAKVRALADFLGERFATPEWALDLGTAKRRARGKG